MAAQKRTGSGGMLIRSICLGLLTVILGLLLSMLNLVRGSITEVSTLPPEADRERHAFYFVKGEERGRSDWESMRAALEGDGAQELIVDEVALNQWARRRLQPSAATEENAASTASFQSVNFRLSDERMQIGMYLQIDLPVLRKNPVLYLAEGYFINDGNGPTFVVERASLGRCPIPAAYIPALANWSFEWALGMTAQLEESDFIAERWGRIEELRIEDAMLHMTLL